MRVARRILAGAIIGALVGLLLLGVGGRLAMRAVAMHNGAAGVFNVEGTITVLLAGAGSGALGGVIRSLLDLPRRLPVIARFAIFVLACVLLTLRGLHPLDANRLWLFMPLVGAYVALVEVAWRRRIVSQNAETG